MNLICNIAKRFLKSKQIRSSYAGVRGRNSVKGGDKRVMLHKLSARDGAKVIELRNLETKVRSEGNMDDPKTRMYLNKIMRRYNSIEARQWTDYTKNIISFDIESQHFDGKGHTGLCYVATKEVLRLVEKPMPEVERVVKQKLAVVVEEDESDDDIEVVGEFFDQLNAKAVRVSDYVSDSDDDSIVS